LFIVCSFQIELDYFLPVAELSVIDRLPSFKGLYTLFLLFYLKGIYPEERDCEQSGLLRIGNWPVPFSMQSNREADVFNCSLLQLLYNSYSHFLLALSLSVGFQKHVFGSLK
jgi:hypothetical protein